VAHAPTSLKITGRPSEKPQRPGFLTSAHRSAAEAEDEFLPDGLVQPTASFDVSPVARSADDKVTRTHPVQSGEVLVLEMSDGSTFIGNIERLRETLRETNPDLVGPDGAIDLELLQSKGAASRGVVGEAVGGLIRKVFCLRVGSVADVILDEARSRAGALADLGVSWAGTRALMWAIEKRLKREPGLYRWTGSQTFEPAELRKRPVQDPAGAPMLVFVHGTASSTRGSFAELRAGDPAVWTALERRFTGGIYALEHRTMSESPIENAIQLADALPDGAHISLVSHSRGGIVADLLCLDPEAIGLEALITDYRFRLPGTGDADPDEARRVIRDLDGAHEEHRQQLSALVKLLRQRNLAIQRYVRVASPASGTKLAGGNIDLFLSGLLTLVGRVPAFFGNPLYSAFRRIVLEIARNRTNPHLVPGIEAMLPDSPMAPFLKSVQPKAGIEMALLAGDIEGGHALKRLGVLITDYLFFENSANDLVVDTPSMLTGVAGPTQARVLFDRGPEVSHFRYFTNQTTRVALGTWLVSLSTQLDKDTPDSSPLRLFRQLPAPGELEGALAAALHRDAAGADRPVVIVLPGVMGTHLAAATGGRIWFDPLAIARGDLGEIAWGRSGVKEQELFGLFYGKLLQHLAKSHVVIPFAYDWRHPLDELGDRFGAFVQAQLAKTEQPIRLLAHSMGGLVVRAAVCRRRKAMDELMERGGARLLMLGTPHQGSHSMVENLIGKGEMLRTLVALDLKHDMQQVLDIVAGFRGPLQLLPKPGFVDHLQASRPGEQTDGGQRFDYQNAETWADFKGKVRDLWFGHGRCATPTQAVLDAASWLWKQDGEARPALPDGYAGKSCYVFGVARNTPCGVRDEGGRLKMVGSPHGDGTVTWASGRIGGIDRFYYMKAAHGDLLSTAEHFPAIVDLLERGATRRLSTTPPASRAIEQPQAVTYDAGPPSQFDADAAARAMLGASVRDRFDLKPRHKLTVGVNAMDLRFVTAPIMVGHYERDPIAGPEAIIDSELLDGDLSERMELGLYPAVRGTAIAVLRPPSELERSRGTLSGVVVTGLGEYTGALSVSDLTEAVRAGVTRFLLQVVDVLGKDDRPELRLATLLLGYNSSLNLNVADSVDAIVRGVLEANEKFASTTRLNLRVTHLDIVELYLDTAITAVYRLVEQREALTERARNLGTELAITDQLTESHGVRPRLFESRGDNSWPRMIVTDADNDGMQLASGAAAPGATVSSSAAPSALAQRLRFLYVGQRARAESVMHQRQPGFIEQQIRRQINSAQWQEDFGRLLFQLMVPADFKEAARAMDGVVLVVDNYTANLPWELMLADEMQNRPGEKKPLAVRMRVVRQLATGRYRQVVRSLGRRTALVIGNPSVDRFKEFFRSSSGKEINNPPSLVHAEEEAEAVAAVLGSLGYAVESVIGDDRTAYDVFAALFRDPWRIVHISAHGVFQQMHVDGKPRSGVVLSDGFLVTAAEIASLESVPELVFLNCCHLAKVNFVSHDANRLAASLSRELIEAGVRCVIVAGWAVDDLMAMRFGQVFYERLLTGGDSFGVAVFKARQVVWNESPDDITWGAFQAYGDPAWRAEKRGSDVPFGQWKFVTVHDALDHLARAEAEASRRKDRLTPREIKERLEEMQRMLDERCPKEILETPAVQAAIGRVWFAYGELAKARESLAGAVKSDDRSGRVSLRDAQNLANAETRLSDDGDDANIYLPLAIRRLESLAGLVASTTDQNAIDAELNPERAKLLGSAYKRSAVRQARKLLQGGLSEADRRVASAALDDALARSGAAYCQSAGGGDNPLYNEINGLMYVAARSALLSEDARREAIAAIKRCVARADEAARKSPADVWSQVMPFDARLVLALLERRLEQADPVGTEALDQLKAGYGQALRSLIVKRSELDSVAKQPRMMADFIEALGLAFPQDPGPKLSAARLDALARWIDPTLGPRRQSAPAVASATPAVIPPAKPAKTPKPSRRPKLKRPPHA
jgi:CHAT domain-containing protein